MSSFDMTGKYYGASAGQKRKPTLMDTILDILLFIVVSLGYIFQGIYWTICRKSEKSLSGEIALVTGGAGGLGRLLAERLARQGATVVLWDINKEGVEEAVHEIKTQINGKCYGYVVNIADRKDVYRAAEVVKAEVGDVSLLLNNAGVASGKLLMDTPDEMIVRTFEVNAMAHFWTTKAFLPAMIEKDHGHIVTVASLAGHVGIGKLVDYCSSKFAAVGFDEALRLELECQGKYGVHTTVVCPFFIQATGMFEEVNSRFVPTLNCNTVADEVINAIRRNDQHAIIPSYLRVMLAVKWIFPWGCISGFLRRIVPDASPAPTCEVSVNNNNTLKL